MVHFSWNETFIQLHIDWSIAFFTCVQISFGGTLRLLYVKFYCFLLLGKQKYRMIYHNMLCFWHNITCADNESVEIQKSKGKIQKRSRTTTDLWKIRCRTRCHGGVSILWWTVTPTVCSFSLSGNTENLRRWMITI